MSLNAREVPLGRPAAVAIHDDGDMPGKPIEVDLPDESLLGGTGRTGGENIVES
jgi:hypothetical protein